MCRFQSVCVVNGRNEKICQVVWAKKWHNPVKERDTRVGTRVPPTTWVAASPLIPSELVHLKATDKYFFHFFLRFPPRFFLHLRLLRLRKRREIPTSTPRAGEDPEPSRPSGVDSKYGFPFDPPSALNNP